MADRGRHTDTVTGRSHGLVRHAMRWSICVLVVTSTLSISASTALATPTPRVTLEEAGEGVQWKSLAAEGFTPEWGYKVAVSRVPKGCTPDPLCRETQYFEVQRSVDPQEYIPYAQNLKFTPSGDVYVGVGALSARGTDPPVYSEELAVPAVDGPKVPGDAAPSILWTEGNSVFWEQIGNDEWGYKVAVSNRPRCFTSKCRTTEPVELQRTAGPQSYSPCLADLHFAPIDDTVYVGVGTIQDPGGTPLSYTGSEVAVTVPECPPPTVLGSDATSVSETTAMLNGTVDPNGNDVSSCRFDYGTSTNYGSTAPCSSLPGSGTAAIPVSAQLVGLSSGTTYHFRIVATGVSGTSYGGDQTFSTVQPPKPPPPPKPPLPAPANIVAPSIGGKTVSGYAVSATAGIWEHGPTGYSYQWQLCDATGSACANVAGATNTSLTLASPDVGHRLRLSVVASNEGGSVAATSAPSSVVGSKVEAKVEWTFNWFSKYTIVEGLDVVGIPPGGVVEVACRGRHCPFALAHAAPTATRARCRSRHCPATAPGPAGSQLNLASMFKRRHLSPGTVITVRVTLAGWVGRSFVFTVLAGRHPNHESACLAPGSTQPGREC
jgi:hypothetical protein